MELIIFLYLKKKNFMKKEYSETRVIQKNLLYITNLPLNFTKSQILSKDFLGIFNITKVIQTYTNDSSSAYITFFTPKDVENCIKEWNESLVGGKVIKLQYGTTKYCTFYMKGEVCPNSECLYLHSKANTAAINSLGNNNILNGNTTREKRRTGLSSNLHSNSNSSNITNTISNSISISNLNVNRYQGVKKLVICEETFTQKDNISFVPRR